MKKKLFFMVTWKRDKESILFLLFLFKKKNRQLPTKQTKKKIDLILSSTNGKNKDSKVKVDSLGGWLEMGRMSLIVVQNIFILLYFWTETSCIHTTIRYPNWQKNWRNNLVSFFCRRERKRLLNDLLNTKHRGYKCDQWNNNYIENK